MDRCIKASEQGPEAVTAHVASLTVEVQLLLQCRQSGVDVKHSPALPADICGWLLYQGAGITVDSA
jgi:hypothetical protein